MKMRTYINIIHIMILTAAVLFSVVAVILGIVFAATSGGEIPIEFDAAGQPLEYASAWETISLPVILLAVNVLMVVFVVVAPVTIWNMPVKITEKNGPILYREAATMVSLIALVFGLMSLIGTICLYKAYEAASGIMIAGTVTLVVISIVFLIKMIRDGRKYA